MIDYHQTGDSSSLQLVDDRPSFLKDVLRSDSVHVQVLWKGKARPAGLRQKLRGGKKHRIIHHKGPQLLHLPVQFPRGVANDKLLFFLDFGLVASQKPAKLLQSHPPLGEAGAKVQNDAAQDLRVACPPPEIDQSRLQSLQVHFSLPHSIQGRVISQVGQTEEGEAEGKDVRGDWIARLHGSRGKGTHVFRRDKGRSSLHSLLEGRPSSRPRDPSSHQHPAGLVEKNIPRAHVPDHLPKSLSLAFRLHNAQQNLPNFRLAEVNLAGGAVVKELTEQPAVFFVDDLHGRVTTSAVPAEEQIPFWEKLDYTGSSSRRGRGSAVRKRLRAAFHRWYSTSSAVQFTLRQSLPESESRQGFERDGWERETCRDQDCLEDWRPMEGRESIILRLFSKGRVEDNMEDR